MMAAKWTLWRAMREGAAFCAVAIKPRRPTSGLTLIALGTLAGAVLHAQDVPGSSPGAAKLSGEGETLYRQICQACHMADARGGGSTGARIPALANDPRLADRDDAIRTVLKGRGGMPAFDGVLTPAQTAAVLTYVRGHFNKFPGPVTEADVRRVGASR